MTQTSPRHFLDLSSFSKEQLRAILNSAKDMKAEYKLNRSNAAQPLRGKAVALVFEQPSMRTRVSFDVGIRQLGGEAIMLTGREIELGEREAISDVARVLSRYVDAIMIRLLSHKTLHELASHSTVPVINGLTRTSHPCQAMADILTFEEKKGSIEGAKIAWVGECSNVLTSWIHAGAKLGCELHIASPSEFTRIEPIEWAKAQGMKIKVSQNPAEAVSDADAVITDGLSLGDLDTDRRQELLLPYQVNAVLMANAKKETIFMHCLPAHRGEEVTDEVLDGAQSVVFDEAENRLHAQKAILAWCFGAL